MGNKMYLVIWVNNEINNVYVVLADSEEEAKDKVCNWEHIAKNTIFGRMTVYNLEKIFEDYYSDVWAFAN